MRAAAGERAVRVDHLLLGRNAERRDVDAGEAAAAGQVQVIAHARVGEIADRVPERRELPVDDGERRDGSLRRSST